MSGTRILVVEPDLDVRTATALSLEGCGFVVMQAVDAPGAAMAVPGFRPDALLARIGAPDEAAALVRTVRAAGSDAVLLAVVVSDRVDLAVDALRGGAEAYLPPRPDAGHVGVLLEKALERRRLRRERAELREAVRLRCRMVGNAPELQLVQEVVRRVAPTKATVLVTGETGTGRELVAQAIHEASPRRERPFLTVRCAAVSETLLESELFGHEAGAFTGADVRQEGRLEAADGGTLCLHDVAQLPPALQVKLLRVLQRGEFERLGGRDTLRVDVRIVAASTRDLAEEVRAGRFRDDLYYRLNVVAVALPPLRERKADIPALVQHFLALASRAEGKDVRSVSPGALSTLFAYDWPGNVRELQGMLEQAVRLCPGSEIAAEHLSPILNGAAPAERSASALIPGASLFDIEREAILRTLEEVDGSTARAAEVLGISIRKIQYRLKEYRSGHVPGRRGPRGGSVFAPLAKLAG